MAKKKTARQIVAEYEQRLALRQRKVSEQIDALYSEFTKAISPYAAGLTLPRGIFTLNKFPALEARIDVLINQLNKSIEATVVDGINGAWELSNAKNNFIADIRIDTSLLPSNVVVKLYDPNYQALQAFKKRQINGLGLSDRIYKSGQQLKAELEAGIGIGTSKGTSASQMGRDLRQYLKEPDKLFRRVRDQKGILRLSKNAKAFNPGQGIYRSSRANIERLTRSEVNMAYRQEDSNRYKQQPFVLGFEIRLSEQHQKCDLCDSMAGIYPSDFVFTGFHPHCLCYTVPILMSEEQFIQYRKLLQSGTATPDNIAKIAQPVKEIPASANTWMNNNIEALSRLKKPPIWYRQNKKYVPELIKQ